MKGFKSIGFLLPFSMGRAWLLAVVVLLLFVELPRPMPPELSHFIPALQGGAILLVVLSTLGYAEVLRRSLKRLYDSYSFSYLEALDISLIHYFTWSFKERSFTVHMGSPLAKRRLRLVQADGESTMELGGKSSDQISLSPVDRSFYFFLYRFERAFLPPEEEVEYFLAANKAGHPLTHVEGGVPMWLIFTSKDLALKLAPTRASGVFLVERGELSKLYEAAADQELAVKLFLPNEEDHEVYGPLSAAKLIEPKVIEQKFAAYRTFD